MLAQSLHSTVRNPQMRDFREKIPNDIWQKCLTAQKSAKCILD